MPNYGPRLGKLVHQLPGVVTLAYDLRLTHMIARWKDLSEDYDGKDDFFLKNRGVRFPKKCHLGPQNGSGSSGPEKLLKIVNCAIIKETENVERNNGGGLGGLGRWQPISTWIIPPPLGSNGPHCVEFLSEMRELLLSWVSGELFCNL